MILQVLFYAEPETFVLKCKFNLKSVAPPMKISGCATDLNGTYNTTLGLLVYLLLIMPTSVCISDLILTESIIYLPICFYLVF